MKIRYYIAAGGLLVGTALYYNYAGIYAGASPAKSRHYDAVKPKNVTAELDWVDTYLKPGYSTHPSEISTQEFVSFPAQLCEGSDTTITRTGTLLRRKNAQGVVVMMHGFMCSELDTRFFRMMFPEYHVLIFDMRAHGNETEEQLCTFGCNESFDVIGAVNYIKSLPEFEGLPRIAYAFSMGAVSTIIAQHRDPSLFDALILDCPFESTENLIERMVDQLEYSLWGYDLFAPLRSFFKRHAYHPYVQSVIKAFLRAIAHVSTRSIETCMLPCCPSQAIKSITVPIFLISCKNDEKVPVHAIKQLYENVPGFKRLWITNGRRHMDSFFVTPELYGYRVNTFIKMVLSDKWRTLPHEKMVEDPDALPF